MLNPNPNWSGDSNQIVYVARNEDTGQTGGQVVHLHNLSSGEDREVYHALGRVFCAWATQQPNLFCTDTAEKTDIFSIAADSREIARLHTFPAPRHLWIRSPSLDNRGLYIYDVLGDGEREVLLWEIATARETVLEQSAPGAYVFVSQDGRWLVRRAKPNIEVRPTSGGAWKSLAALRLSEATGHVNGNWLLYHDIDSTGKHSLFRVPTAGGPPERLGNFPTNSPAGTIEISPDGSKILVSAGEFETGYELWSLENFVPPAPKR